MVFKIFCCVLIFGTCATVSFKILTEWQQYKEKYGKVYSNQEDKYRQAIFQETVQLIEEHNAKYEQGLTTFEAGLNKYSDHKIEEISKPSKISNFDRNTRIQTPKTQVPDSIDWRDFGVINSILDQNYCMSCWAFAVLAAVEANIAIYQNRTLLLSPENLIDCVYSDFNCSQEMEKTALEDSYKYIINNGIATEDSYPYDENTAECRYNATLKAAEIADFATVPEGDEEELKTVVGTVGPVSVIITTDTSFMGYRKGVYYKENCTLVEEPYNHAVTVIGYGEEDGVDYWLVRNEWSIYFGEEGYIKMARNRDNMCGIATYASYPIVDKLENL